MTPRSACTRLRGRAGLYGGDLAAVKAGRLRASTRDPEAHVTTTPAEIRPLSLSAAAAVVAHIRGRAPNRATIRKWITDGVTAADGSRVRLAAKKVGVGWVVTPAAIDAFVEALSALPADAAA